MAAEPTPLDGEESQSEDFSVPAPVDDFFRVPYLALMVTDVRNDTFRFKDANDVLQFQLYGDPRKSNQTPRILRNGAGNALVFLQRKKKSLRYKWKAYRGDEELERSYLFSTRKDTGFHKLEELQVYLPKNDDKKKPDFVVKGDFKNHVYSIIHNDEPVMEVAEVMTEVDSDAIRLDKHDFAIKIYPGVDHAFIIALVAIVEQQNADAILPKLTLSKTKKEMK